MLTEAFINAKYIIDKLEQNGYQAYFVGGAVRDQFLGRQIGDVDIATSASPTIVQQIFDKVIPVGVEHGTVVVRYKNESYEVTTFRIDGTYTDSRHPDSVQFVNKIELDLARRDFTINAIAMDKDGNFIDPYNGRKDIDEKRIRTVGNPEERFNEDPLRMLRALRFASQLGFRLDNATFETIKRKISSIEKLSIERVAIEMKKLFMGLHTYHALQLFLQVKAYNYIPVMSDNRKLIQFLQHLDKPIHSFHELITVFHAVDPSFGIDQWIKEWKLSNKIKNNVIKLVMAIQYLKENGLDEWLIYQLPVQLDEAFLHTVNILHPNKKLALPTITSIRKNLPITDRKDLQLKGSDLIQLFPNHKKGPWINQLITKMEYKVVKKEISNTKEELERWVKQWNPPEIN